MSRFVRELKKNIAALPANLSNGLRPGANLESEPLVRRMRRNFVFHLHPVKVTERALKPATTLGLGLITATLFLALAISGVLLMVYYVPTVQHALASTQDIQHAVMFGSFFRALHRFAAHAMVFTAFLHLVRICFTGAYFRRELNWLIGISLFLLTLGLAFTGYLLPWDQLSYWAVRVSTNLLDYFPGLGGTIKQLLLGDETVGQAALTRFYMLHVALLPSLMLALLILHVWRIRKDGGLARVPDEGDEPATIPTWPHLVVREAVLVIGVLIVLTLVATFVSAPLGGLPDMQTPSNPEKTPWYFLWLQEMVSYSAPVGGFVFPGVFLLGLLVLPFMERDQDGVGRWFGAGPGRRVALLSLAAALVFFVGCQWCFQSGGIQTWLAGGSTWLGDIFNPATAMLFFSGVSFVIAGQITGSTRASFLAGFVVLLVAIAGFTIIAWCRGPNWIFYWPWEEWPRVN